MIFFSILLISKTISVTCIDGCEVCTTEADCSKCKEGYKLRNINGVVSCVLIVCNLKHCKTGCDDTSCKECEEGYEGTSCNKCAAGYEESWIMQESYCKKVVCPQKCIECRTSTYCDKCEEPFTVSGSNYCNKCIDGYEFYQDKDGNYFCKVLCPTLHNCDECATFTTCKTCKTGYALDDNNDCTKCAGSYKPNPSNQAECILACTVKNCIECATSTDKCEKCQEPYLLDSQSTCNSCIDGYDLDKSGPEAICVEMTCSIIPHCDQCTTFYKCTSCEFNFDLNDIGECTKCKHGLTPEINEKGEIVCNRPISCPSGCLLCSNGECQACKPGYAFNSNGDCTEESLKVPYSIDDRELLSNVQFTRSKQQIIDLTSTNDNAKKYYSILRVFTQTIEVKNPNDADIQVNIPYLKSSNEINIKPENENTKLQIYCEYNSNLKISNSDSTTIAGGGLITLSPVEDGKEIKLDKIIPSQGLLKFDSKVEISANELSIYGPQVFSLTENTKTNIKKITVNDQSMFISQTKIDINDVEIGKGSTFYYTADNDYTNANFVIIYEYLSNSLLNPLEIDKSAAKPKSITVTSRADANSIRKLDEYDTDFLIATFDSLDRCNEFKGVYKADSRFGEATCDPQDDKIFLIALDKPSGNNGGNDKKKGGLSGGAIAGIVIACVVVVAGAGVLVWYFVFYKRKVGVSAEEAEP